MPCSWKVLGGLKFAFGAALICCNHSGHGVPWEGVGVIHTAAACGVQYLTFAFFADLLLFSISLSGIQSSALGLTPLRTAAGPVLCTFGLLQSPTHGVSEHSM